MERMKLFIVSIVAVALSHIFAYGADRRINFYCAYIAPTTLWNYLQEMKGTSAYDENHKLYADFFSPADRFEYLLNDPISQTGANLLNFSVALSEVSESGDNELLRRLVEQYQATFAADRLGIQVLKKAYEQCVIEYPDDVVFWKIPGDGKRQYQQITSAFQLYYEEEFLQQFDFRPTRVPSSYGDLRTICRITLWGVKDESRDRLCEFYSSEGETLFILVHKGTGNVRLLLRKPNAHSYTLASSVSTACYQWCLYGFNLRTLEKRTHRPLSFLGSYGGHNRLKRVAWDGGATIGISFMDERKDGTGSYEVVEGELL